MLLLSALSALSAPGPGAETDVKVLSAGKEENLSVSNHFW